ncbi:MAG TPA: universal stress protein [Pseudolabrys sp.]|nr:universal stress protein [Pseudolabrys sp.]
MKRIIAATDGSPGANRALDLAVRLAKTGGCELTILTVGGNVSSAELRRLAEVDGDLSKIMTADATDILERARKRVRRLGLPAVKLQTEWGEPAETLIDTVKREKPDMLVIGRRGRSRLSSLLLGSVSQKVATLAPCAVLVVP